MSNTLLSSLNQLPGSSRFTNEQLEVIYSLAYSHVNQHQYQQALRIFSFLCLYGPTRKHYLTGLALCLQMCDRLDEAISIYSVIQTLFPEQYDATLKVAECQLALGQVDEANETLNLLLETGQLDPTNYKWLPKVRAMQKLLNNKAL